jgi:intein/homing endonuclease
MITYKAGRTTASQSIDEAMELLLKDLVDLNPEERSLALKIATDRLSKAGIPMPPMLASLVAPPYDPLDPDSEPPLSEFARAVQELPPGDDLYDLLGTAHFKSPPVDMETFVMDPYFLGETCSSTYPQLLRDLTEIFKGDYNEIVLTGALNVGKCIAGDTRIVCAQTGISRTVEEWASDGAPFDVESLAYDTTKEWTRGRAVAFASGQKPCVRLRARSGREVTLSTDHPVLTSQGWVLAGELQAGQCLVTSRTRPEPTDPLLVSDAEVAWAAYFLADGNAESAVWCSGCAARADDYTACVQALGLRVEDPYKRWHAQGAHYIRAHRLQPLLRAWGLDCLSKDKRLPSQVWRLSTPQLALFLNRFFSCDGHVSAQGQIQLVLASRALIEETQEILLRLGVHSFTAYKRATYSYAGERRDADSWRLTISGRGPVLRFLDAVGSLLGKEERCAQARGLLESRTIAANLDTSPFDGRAFVRLSREVGRSAKTDPVWKSLRVSSATQRAGHERLSRIATEAGGLPPWADWWQDPNIYWDTVTEVTPIGVIPVFDITVPGVASFVAHGFVLHNTFESSIGMCRGMYELSLMRNPQRSFGLSADTQIIFAGFSVKEELAREVVLKNITGKLDSSPYFAKHFKPKVTQKNIRFPGNVMAVARATTDTAVLGMAVYMALMDEADFMPKRKRNGSANDRMVVTSMAKAIYDGLRRRIQGRFGRYGKIFLPCSKTTVESFLQTRIAEAAKDPRIFVSDYAQWEVKPDTYSETSFWVLCGNENVASRIVYTQAEMERLRAVLPERTTLLEVPDNYLTVFENDLDGSLRDLGGIATVAMSPFFQQRESVQRIVDPKLRHPFSVQVLDPSLGGYFESQIMVRNYEERDPYEGTRIVARPIINPYAPRYLHIDASTKQCASGLVMLHQAGTVPLMRTGGYTEQAPLYIVDFALQVIPPPTGEIELGLFRRLIYDLTDMGYPLVSVSLDQYQSVDTLQILGRQGYTTRRLSADWNAYQALKNTIYEGRIKCYEYEPLMRELRSVEADWEKRQIVKPLEYQGKQGSKDLSDALAGALRAILENPYQESLPPLKGHTTASGIEGADIDHTAPEPMLFGEDIPMLLGSSSPDTGDWRGDVVQGGSRQNVISPRPFRGPGLHVPFMGAGVGITPYNQGEGIRSRERITTRSAPAGQSRQVHGNQAEIGGVAVGGAGSFLPLIVGRR